MKIGPPDGDSIVGWFMCAGGGCCCCCTACWVSIKFSTNNRNIEEKKNKEIRDQILLLPGMAKSANLPIFFVTNIQNPPIRYNIYIKIRQFLIKLSQNPQFFGQKNIQKSANYLGDRCF